MSLASTNKTAKINNHKHQQSTSNPDKLLLVKPQQTKTEDLTFGQKLADSMAAKVGSWAFLIGQTTVLTAWVGFNSIPGLPHWDQPPFILLNLVFSFASAYTAPIVLMSQNRQSDEDRKNAKENHQVNLQAAQNLELLHQKFDVLYSQKLEELTLLIKEQQQTSTFVPNLPIIESQNNEKLNTVPQPHFPSNQVASDNIIFKQLHQSSTPHNNILHCFNLTHKSSENNQH